MLAAATDLPLSVDLENGHGPEPTDAATAIARAAEAGAVGGSIEDFDPERGLYEPGLAAERVAAAVEAASAVGFEFTLTARAENHIRGNPDLDDTIARLQSYEAAGADVLYAPGLRTAEEIRAISEATSRPLNVLARPKLTMSEIAAAGGQRVSLGGSLAWVAAAGMIDGRRADPRRRRLLRDRGEAARGVGRVAGLSPVVQPVSSSSSSRLRSSPPA